MKNESRLEKELPHEDWVTIEEASELIDFFRRYDKVSASGVFRDSLKYDHDNFPGSFRYLDSGELMLKGLYDKKEEGISHFFKRENFVGSDMFLVNKKKDSLIFTHYGCSYGKDGSRYYEYSKNGENLNLFEEAETKESYHKRERLESDKRFPKKEYEKVNGTWGCNLWPVFFKYNVLPSFNYRNTEFEIPIKRSTGDFNNIYMNKNSFLQMIGEIYGKENKSELDKLFCDKELKYPGHLHLSLDKNNFSDLTNKKDSKKVPLSLGLEGASSWRSIYFNKPTKDPKMILRHDVENIDKKLIENIVKPEDVGNGVVVMSRENIPKYLTRRIGL